MTTRLFTTFYPEKQTQRRAEYEHCLAVNLNCSAISHVYVLDEISETLCVHDKLRRKPISQRPTYHDFFHWINSLVNEHDYSILANSDIALDDSIQIIKKFDWNTSKMCLALSRWDIDPQGDASLFEHGDSQDVWVFKGKIEGVNGNFPLGVYDCDNKIAWELEQAGYRVINPCYAVRTYHHHQSGYRSYEIGIRPDYGIRPPFRYVEPDNYWGLFRAWKIKRELKLDYLPWMMTRQRFWRYPIPKLVLRVCNKIGRLLTSRKQVVE